MHRLRARDGLTAVALALAAFAALFAMGMLLFSVYGSAWFLPPAR